MQATYAVKWREPDGNTYVGGLVLGPRALRLEGRAHDAPAVDRQIRYDEVRGVRIGSSGADRLDNRPALVVEGADGSYHVTSAGSGAGILQELVDRLAALKLATPRRATVVVPLKPGALAEARELVGAGPPFDPAETFLTRHQVLLTEAEALFVFEAAGDEALAALLNQVDLWSAAVPWRDLIAGAPRLAEIAYAWERPEPRVLPAVGLGF